MSMGLTHLLRILQVSPMLVGHQGCHGRNARVILAQEGSPWVYLAGVFSIWTWIRLLLMWLLRLLTSLNSKR
jgi:hypothetical protein